MIKLGLHLLFCIPAGIIFSLATVIVFEVGILDAILIIMAPVLFTLFIDLLGLLNLWKPKFDWVNETVCVKQSMPVMLTMFISMGLAFVIAACYIFMGDFIPLDIYMYLIFIIFIVANIILYYMLNTWGIKRFEQL